MTKNAVVALDDLGQALDMLEGLSLILQRFHHLELGRNTSEPLLDELQEVHGYMEGWAPVRHQIGVGQGWQYVLEDVARLRDRLLEGYANAAL